MAKRLYALFDHGPRCWLAEKRWDRMYPRTYIHERRQAIPKRRKERDQPAKWKGRSITLGAKP